MHTQNERALAEEPQSGASDPFECLRLQPPEGGSRVDWAYGVLKDLILRNRLAPGYRALEAGLAERLGISRTPMRETLLRLQADGLVELTPRRGVRVLPISAADLREIYQLLCCLEATAAELAAGRGLNEGSPEIVALNAANDALHAALQAGDLDSWAQMDERFHRLLVEHCGNARLKRVVRSIWDQSHRARMLTMSYRPRPVRSHEEHRAVVEAIVRGDARIAWEIHSAHRRRGMELILGLIAEHRLDHL